MNFRFPGLFGTAGRGGFIGWDEILTVTVFKRDLFTLDPICLRLTRNQADRSGRMIWMVLQVLKVLQVLPWHRIGRRSDPMA